MPRRNTFAPFKNEEKIFIYINYTVVLFYIDLDHLKNNWDLNPKTWYRNPEILFIFNGFTQEDNFRFLVHTV